MSEERPRVSPQLMATLIDSTPDRVRRRLDRAPDSASQWNWQIGDVWSVETGGETVTLPRGLILSLDQLSCTCLLSPKCFHVLACLTVLEVAVADVQHGAEDSERVETASSDENKDIVRPSEKQQHAAAELANSIAQLLRVGVANAGVVVQSGLLRAVHQCRAEGLHRAAAVGLRVIAGTSQLRARSPEADPIQLAQDIADVLETTQRIRNEKGVGSFWIGTARRKQLPVRPRKLHGLFAEPIITRSGYAGAAVYFLGEDDAIYTASDVRPGEAQHARDAYLGGIEIGSLIQPAKQLARGLYLGTDLTASMDGRLGRGKSIKIVEQGQSSWEVETIQKRFQIPLSEQWNAVYKCAALPPDGRPAGWDFVFLGGTVLGAVGPELLLRLNTQNQTIRLGIANETEALLFRENLRMLSFAPGLHLQLIARLELKEPRIAYPLAIAPVESNGQKDSQPRLALPESLQGRLCLGFDEIQSRHLTNAWSAPVVLGETYAASNDDDPLRTLRRRWIAMMLAGAAFPGQGKTNTVVQEIGTLNRTGFKTGAALLNSLSYTYGGNTPSRVDIFLSVALYLRSSDHELAKSKVLIRV